MIMDMEVNNMKLVRGWFKCPKCGCEYEDEVYVETPD